MTKKLTWRLGKLPETSELRDLVEGAIITKDEARNILFEYKEPDERDKKSFESEIKFLRELVEKLSNNNNTKIIETIKYIEKPYYNWGWYQPYQYWCNSGTSAITGGSSYTLTANAGNVLVSSGGMGTCTGANTTKALADNNANNLAMKLTANSIDKQSNGSFSNIKTF